MPGTPETLYLIRHGMTIWNFQRRLQGRRDSPLSFTGKAQAARAAAVLHSVNADALLCSPLGRARETASIVGRRIGLEPRVIGDYREIAFGNWEGYTAVELDVRWPGQWQQWRADVWNVRPPGGENYEDARERAEQVLERMQALQHRRVVVVGHYAFNRLLLALWFGWTPRQAVNMHMPHDLIYRVGRSGDEWTLAYQRIGEDGIEHGNGQWTEGVLPFGPRR